MTPEVPVLDVEHVAAVLNIRGTFALEFEHEEAAVMAGGDEVDLRVRGKDPEAVFAPVG